MKNLDTKQKIMLVLTVALFGIIAWQVYDMMGIGSSTGGQTVTTLPVTTHQPNTSFVQTPPAPQPQAVTELRVVDTELSDSQREYLELVSEYQLAKMRRLLAQERAALQSAVGGGTYGWDSGFDNEYTMAGYGNNVNNRHIYTLNYVGYQNNRWIAILSHNNALYTVAEGGELPDGAKVIDINTDGVILQRGSDRQYVQFATMSPFNVQDAVVQNTDEQLLEELLQELSEEEFSLPEQESRLPINQIVEPVDSQYPGIVDDITSDLGQEDIIEAIDPDWLDLIFQELTESAADEGIDNDSSVEAEAPSLPLEIDLTANTMESQPFEEQVTMLPTRDALPQMELADNTLSAPETMPNPHDNSRVQEMPDSAQVPEDEWFDMEPTQQMPAQESVQVPQVERRAPEQPVTPSWDEEDSWGRDANQHDEVSILPVEPEPIEEEQMPEDDNAWLNDWLEYGFSEDDYYAVEPAQMTRSSAMNTQNDANTDAWYVWDGEQWVEERRY